jgi:hypothetical protein
LSSETPNEHAVAGLRPRSRGESERLAQRLVRPRALRLALRRQVARAERVGAPTAGAEADRAQGASLAEPADAAKPISIWRPRRVHGELVFERPQPGPLGDHYAVRKRFTAAKTGRRICFFGESAAAGYLYAPHLTPAGVLEQHLQAVAGARAFEVVDLARTNERLESLVETVERSLQLDPDLFVIFAGNNWNLLETPELSSYFPAPEARVRYARLLRETGLVGAVDQAGIRQLQRGSTALETIAEIARSRSIPVVLIVPEINLADWETLQPCTRLPGNDTARWHQKLEASLRSLEAGSFAEVAGAAHEMLDLDGGLCPTPYRLLARAWQSQGRLREAAEACRAEVATASCATICFLGAPQATPAVQELLRRSAERLGFALVDLPEIFAAHTGSPLPGRRLFLDYCHLTAEGMRVSMAATTARIVGLVLGREIEPERLLATLPDPEISPRADATAKLGAAIHCAHRLLPVGPKMPILEHWCREALAADPGIATTMRDVIAARCSPLPAVLTAAQSSQLDAPVRLGFQHGWRWEFLDVDLLEALASTLERHGGAVRDEVDRRLIDAGPSAGSSGESLELISAGHWREPLERVFPEVIESNGTRRAFHRSPWPRSRFWFASDARSDVALEIRARLPESRDEEGGSSSRRESRSARLEVNGHPVGRVALRPRWQSRTVRVDRRLLRCGCNQVTVRWPPAAPIGAPPLEAVIRRLELGAEADLHPIFGEMFSLRMISDSLLLRSAEMAESESTPRQ